MTTARTAATEPVELPAWWLDAERTLGPILGGVGLDARDDGKPSVPDSLEFFAGLSPEEREGYAAILAYRQLQGLAELDTSIRRLERKLARTSGVTRTQLDQLVTLAEAALPPGDGEEDDDDALPPDEEEEETPAAPAPKVEAKKPAPKVEAKKPAPKVKEPKPPREPKRKASPTAETDGKPPAEGGGPS